MNSLNAIINPSDLRATLFPQTSRYHAVEILKHTTADGREVAYLARRLLPQQDRFETLQEHVVSEGDRPDNIAAQFLGDPEQFWRLADANNDLNPFDLTAEIGRRIRITLPEGVPGVPYA
jgi:hypothetical protein